MEKRTELERDLKRLIIDACKVVDAPDDFPSDAQLIGPDSPLGLDSLDAVEIVFMIQKKYDIRIGGEDTSRRVLASIASLADFISQEIK